MKRLITLVLLFAALFHFNVTAQESYYKMLQDSTVWCYVYEKIFYNYNNYIVDGDTVINDKRYSKIYYFSGDYNRKKANYRCALREEGPKVYYAGEHKENSSTLEMIDGETLLYDFSLVSGDKFGKNKDITVTSLTILENYFPDDENIRRYIQLETDNTVGFWLEGVGSFNKSIDSPLCLKTEIGRNDLVNFVQNGKIHYNNPGITLVKDNIHWLERETAKDNSAYKLTNYLVKGDTVMNEKAYKKVFANGVYHGAMRINAEHKIFYCKKDSESEIRLYDFDWRNLKELHSTNYAGEYFILANSSEMNFYNLKEVELFDEKLYYYKPMTINRNPNGNPFRTLSKEVRLIRQLGLTSGMFSHVETADPNKGYNDLVCLYDGDKLIYLNPDFKENGELTSDIQSLTAERVLMVTNQNGEVVFTLKEGMSTLKAKLFIYGIDGKLISTRGVSAGTTVIGNMPKGVYYYRLEKSDKTPENGKFVVE